MKDRINCMNSRICNSVRECRLFIDPRCRQLIRDMEQVSWKTDANGNPLPRARQVRSHAHPYERCAGLPTLRRSFRCAAVSDRSRIRCSEEVCSAKKLDCFLCPRMLIGDGHPGTHDSACFCPRRERPWSGKKELLQKEMLLWTLKFGCRSRACGSSQQTIEGAVPRMCAAETSLFE